MNVTDYSKIFPIQDIKGNYIINGNGDITIGVKISHKAVFALSEEELQVDITQYINLLKSLPENTVFHKQDFYFTGEFYDNYIIDSVITIKRNKHYYKTKPIRKHTSVVYLTFVTQTNKKNNSLYGLKDYIFAKPFNKLDEVVSKLERETESFINNLKTIDSIKNVELLNKEQLKQYIYKYNTLDLKEDDVIIGTIPGISINDKNFKIGNKNVGVITLLEEGNETYLSKKAKSPNPSLFENKNDYPEAMNLFSSMLFPLSIGLPIDHIINTVIFIKDNDFLVRDLTKDNMFLNVLSSSGLGVAISKKNALSVYKEALQEFGEKGCYFDMNIILFNEDQFLLDKWMDITTSTFKNINSCVPLVENVTSFEIFWANIPGNANFNLRKKFSIVDVAACYLPRESFIKSDTEGYFCVDIFGNPIVENLLFSDSTSNKNVVVFGPSGSGKTNWLCWFIDNNINNHHDVVIINVKPDYVTHCSLHHGIYVNTAVEEYKGINPFYTYKVADKWVLNAEKATLIKAIISHIWKKKERLTNDESSVLSELIEKYFDYVNQQNIEIPTFYTFYDFIDVYAKNIKEETKLFLNFASLKMGLKPFFDGAYKDIFSVKTPIDLLKEKYVVFDLMAVLKDEILFDVYLYYVIEFSMSKIVVNKNYGRFTNIILDECIDSMKGQGGDFVGEQFRKIRSMNGSMAICTQGISYLDAVSDLVKDSIKTNCDIKVLLDHSTATSDFPKIQDYLSLSDNEMLMLGSMIKGKHYRQWFLKKGIDNAKILRNENSEFSNAAYSTSPKDVKAIEVEVENLRLKGIDNTEIALTNFINNKNK